jgi:AcrR family transcriptional regulator
MARTNRSTPKSVRTREAIATAARELFELKGFERTTVRDIGAKAGIDPSMIVHYFGSKDALFARVATPDLRLANVADIDPARIGQTLVRHFLDQWEGPESGGGLPVLLRSAASNDEAATRMQEVFRLQVLPAIARCGPSDTASSRAGLVASQLLGIALTRYVLKLPPVVAMSREFIIRTVGDTVQRYATGQIDGDSA